MRHKSSVRWTSSNSCEGQCFKWLTHIPKFWCQTRQLWENSFAFLLKVIDCRYHKGRILWDFCLSWKFFVLQPLIPIKGKSYFLWLDSNRSNRSPLIPGIAEKIVNFWTGVSRRTLGPLSKKRNGTVENFCIIWIGWWSVWLHGGAAAWASLGICTARCLSVKWRIGRRVSTPRCLGEWYEIRRNHRIGDW